MNRTYRVHIRKKMKSESSNEDEYCVLCGSKTGYQRNEPIRTRLYYIEGAGQLCPRCYHETYST